MNEQARQRGTTLIELSVVIAVLLLLVGVLFIGVTAWKTTLTGAGFWMTLPTCPTGVAYAFSTTVPASGVAYATCPVSGHVPPATQLLNW